MKVLTKAVATATADFSGIALATIHFVNKSVKMYLLPFNVCGNGPIGSTPKTAHFSKT